MFEPGHYEVGLKTGDLSEEEMLRIFRKANRNAAKWLHDPRIPRGLSVKKSFGPFGSSTPDAPEPEYDHIYRFSNMRSSLYLELYPNREKNGRVKFPEEGITWNLRIRLMDFSCDKLSEDDPIDEFGSKVLEELFRLLPCEAVLIRKTDLRENWL